MSARSTPAPTGVQAQLAGTPDQALRRLRRLCIALAVVCAAALPFELGVLRIPPLTAGPRAKPHPTLRILSVNNDPRTAVVGRTRFSVSTTTPGRLLWAIGSASLCAFLARRTPG